MKNIFLSMNIYLQKFAKTNTFSKRVISNIFVFLFVS